MKKISINSLIVQLIQEQKDGATEIYYKGTLMTDKDNSIILTTEKQI